jgi:hypothetical protein
MANYPLISNSKVKFQDGSQIQGAASTFGGYGKKTANLFH